MQLSYKTPIWLYPEPIDFRKQINGLVLLVADTLEADPTSGELFIFRNRRAKQVKLLWYDENGFWLCHKRLERGKFKFPLSGLGAEVWELTRDQLGWLLSGLDFTQPAHLPKSSAKYFY